MLKLKKNGYYENSTKTNYVLLTEGMLSAFSYNWWRYLRVIDDKVVFNRYKYSVTTQRHQRECMELLTEHGIAVDLFVESPKSL